LQHKYRHLRVLIIDEVSMVGKRFFQTISERLKEIKCSRDNMGSLHVILLGDFYQLPPVGDQMLFSKVNDLTPNLWEQFKFYELTQIMCQKEDKEFSELLNRLRIGQSTKQDIQILKTRIVNRSDPKYPKAAPHLFHSNELVNEHNSEIHLRAAGSKDVVLAHDAVSGDFDNSVKKAVLASLKTEKKRPT